VSARFATSRELVEAASAFVPGGVNSHFRTVRPSPLVFARADGAELVDVDGNVFVDYYLGMGPIILGHRLNTSKTFGAYQALIYNKGALVLRMLHFLLSDPASGDDRAFFAMMTDFVERYRDSFASTDDFRAVANEHFARSPVAQKYHLQDLDWFFNQWVYGTEVPAYRMDYSVTPSGDGKAIISAKITQSNVSKDFVMLVPLYADFGKGWTRLGTATLIGNTPVDVNLQLPQAPKRLALAAMSDVLATSIESSKK
jgi:hypothetical protein